MVLAAASQAPAMQGDWVQLGRLCVPSVPTASGAWPLSLLASDDGAHRVGHVVLVLGSHGTEKTTHVTSLPGSLWTLDQLCVVEVSSPALPFVFPRNSMRSRVEFKIPNEVQRTRRCFLS